MCEELANIVGTKSERPTVSPLPSYSSGELVARKLLLVTLMDNGQLGFPLIRGILPGNDYDLDFNGIQ